MRQAIISIMVIWALPMLLFAAKQNNPKEIIQKRTMTSETYQTGENSYKLVVFNRARHYKNKSGRLEKIYPAYIKTNQGYANFTNTLQSVYETGRIYIGERKTLLLEHFTLTGTDNNQESLLNQVIKIEPEILSLNRSGKFHSQSGFGQILLNVDISHARKFDFSIKLDAGWTVEKSAMDIVIKNPENQISYRLSAPRFSDINGKVFPGSYTLNTTGSTFNISVNLSESIISQGILMSLLITGGQEPGLLASEGVYKYFVNQTEIYSPTFGPSWVGRWLDSDTSYYTYRAYEYYDISALSESGVIDSAHYKIWNISSSEDFTIQLKQMSQQYPSSPSVLWTDCENGNSYGSFSSDNSEGYFSKKYDSGDDFCTDLKNNIDNGWFGIGFYQSGSPDDYCILSNSPDTSLIVYYYDPEAWYDFDVNYNFSQGNFTLDDPYGTFTKETPYNTIYQYGSDVQVTAHNQQSGNYFRVFEYWDLKIGDSQQLQIYDSVSSVSVIDSINHDGWFNRRFNFQADMDLAEGGSGGEFEVDGNPEDAPYSQYFIENLTPSFEVEAPTQDIVINNKTVTYNFFKWDDGITSNPRTFTPTGHTDRTAVMKGIHVSNSSTAFSNNGQRKLIETKVNGTTWLHQVYTSIDHIWLEHSNDGGNTWILGNNGQPLDGNNSVSKNPSIAVTPEDGNYYFGIVWQEKYGNFYRIRGRRCTQQPDGNGISILCSNETATLYTETREFYSGYNANPNLCLDGGQSGRYLLTIEKKANSISGGQNYPAGINWFVGHTQSGSGSYNDEFIPPEDHGVVDGTNSSTTSAQLYIDDYGNEIIGANFIYQQGTSTGGIYSGSLYFFLNGHSWDLIEYNDGLISYPYANFSPSIVTLPDSLYAACWIEYETLTYYRYGSSNLSYFDSGVQSASINRGGNSNDGFIAWSKYTGTWYNKSMPFENGTPVSGSTHTLNTSGKYIQLGNGVDGLTNMRVSSFYPFSSPYYFNTSTVLSLSKPASYIVTGRGFMILNDKATFSYRLEGLNVDGQNINFVDVPDTTNFGKLKNLNKALITEPFQLNADSKVVFTERSGFTDSVSASKKLAKNDYIRYKVELIDNATGKVLGTIRNKSQDVAHTPSFKAHSFRLNTNGLSGQSVRAKITLETNCVKEISSKIITKGDIPPEFNRARPAKRSNILMTKSYLEENEALEKSANEQLTVLNIELPKSFALEQNYPNPFNPKTEISYQLPKASKIILKVYDVLGRMVSTLVDKNQDAGSYQVTFDGSNLATGIYIYTIQAGDFHKSKKMLLVK